LTSTGRRTERRTRLPSACDDLSCLRRVHTPCAYARRRSPPRRPPDIRCHRRVFRRGRIPATERRTDLGPRSDDAPRREPPSRRPGCLRPPRHVREWFAKGLLPPALTPALSLTPPTLFPEGKVLLMGLARSRCGHPRVREHSRVQTPFRLRGLPAPGTDDPSTPLSSTDSTVDEDRLPRSHRCRSQRLDGFYDREPAARCLTRLVRGF
jgi:hypothetical protein